MKTKNELKIFRKMSIGYLKKMYGKSMSYIFDKNSWVSTSEETYGEPKLFLHTRKSLKRFGNELKIFKAPTIVGLKIIYYKSVTFLFDNNSPQPQTAMASEDNYLYRDLSNPIDSQEQSEKELKIFKYPNIEYLKSLYSNSIGRL
jgi:effector-binding domain-containing protein